MTDPAALYSPHPRARQRAVLLDRIGDALACGLQDIPDVFLVLIDLALARDLRGVSEVASRHLRSFQPDEA